PPRSSLFPYTTLFRSCQRRFRSVKILAVISGVLLILMVLWETFETIVLPRRVTRQFRLTRLFYRSTWRPWTAIAALRSNKKKHEDRKSTRLNSSHVAI